jgi:ABC-2 type transport system permease protein
MVLGIGLILATMAVFFRDLEYLWGVMLMLIMYCSSIFYYPSLVISGGHGWVLKINPLYAVITNFRNAVIDGVPLETGALMYSVIFSVVALLAGIWMFYKNQDKFILNI